MSIHVLVTVIFKGNGPIEFQHVKEVEESPVGSKSVDKNAGTKCGKFTSIASVLDIIQGFRR